MRFTRFASTVAAAVLVLVAAFPAFATQRVALVIGNAAYEHTSPLSNPANDARLFAESLRRLGFDVNEQINLKQKEMRRAVSDFIRKVEASGRDTFALLYYAGHGVQVSGGNYLIPVDADIRGEADVPIETVSAGEMFDSLKLAGADVNVVILDACRNNPFASASRAMSRGLARMVAPAGSIIAYATAPGTVAEDGGGGNSTFTKMLSEVVLEPGLTIEQVFKKVRIRVHEATNGQQLPTEENQLLQDVSFAEKTAAPTTEEPSPAPALAPAPSTSSQGNQGDPQLAFFRALELNTLEGYEAFLKTFPESERADHVRKIVRSMSDEAMWRRTSESNSRSAFEQYLIAFPDGTYATEARERIARLEDVIEPSPPQPSQSRQQPEQPALRSDDCGAPHGPYRVVDIEPGDVLNIRAGPGSEFSLIFPMPPDAAGIAVGRCTENGRWCAVRYRCHEGWAAMRFLAIDSVPVAADNLYRVIGHTAPDMLNVRAGPSTGDAIVSRIPANGTNVRVLRCQSVAGYEFKWCVVDYRGAQGWAYAKYLAGMTTNARPQ